MTSLRRSWWLALVVALAVGGGSVGCQAPTPPTEASAEYNQLVQQALAQAEARPDTTFFWLSNTSSTRARTLMLDLGLDYLRYDRGADVLCLWTGEGLWPARGFVTAPVSSTIPADSVGVLCNIEGTCAVDSLTATWSRFRCE
jgi:hypothetical protein